MNRFSQPSISPGRKIVYLLPPVAFLLFLLLFLSGVASVGDTTSDKQTESLETAISRSIVQCYAVEGIYPPDLQYLQEHYGITYDPSVFLVDYEYYGGNLIPEFTVLRKKKATE